MSSNTSILVTAIGSLSACSVIDSLRSAGYGRIIGCDTNPGHWLTASTKLDRFYRILAPTEPGYTAEIESICNIENVQFIVALTDPEIDILARQASQLASRGTKLTAPPLQVVRIARDKLALHRCFRDDPDICTIPTFPLQQYPTISCPMLAKPRRGRSSQGHFLIHDDHDLEHAAHHSRGQDYVIQPLINGPIHVVDVVRHAASGRSFAVCREELLRTPNGAGTTVRVISNPALESAARLVADRLGTNGCVNMEFIEHNRDYLLMDVNPRFSAGVGFSVLAGYDFPAAHIHCFDGSEFTEPPRAINEGVFTRRTHETTALPPPPPLGRQP